MKFSSFVALAGTIFFLSAGTGVLLSEAAAKDGSGKVKPKITVIQPKEVKGKVGIVQYPVPTKYATPYGIAIDSKNRVWSTLMSGNSLAVIDPSKNEFKEYRIPSTEGLPESKWEYDSKNRTTPKDTFNVYSVGSPGNVIVDKNDKIWFVMHLGNSIVNFDPVTETFTEYLLPTKNAQPYDLAEDSAGRIWFIEKNTASFGYLDQKSKKVSEIKLPASSNLMGIAVDSKNQIWLSEVNGNYIGRYDQKTRKFKKFLIPSVLSQPGKMRFGSENKLWFCAPHSKQIGVLYTDQGMFGMVEVPGYNAAPQALVPSKDGKIWYLDSMMNMIGYFDTGTASWKSFDIPSHGAQPMSIAIDSKGDIWFTESDRVVNQISRVILSSVPAPGSPDSDVAVPPPGGSHGSH